MRRGAVEEAALLVEGDVAGRAVAGAEEQGDQEGERAHGEKPHRAIVA